MHHIYSNAELLAIKDFRIQERARGANARFEDKIVSLDILRALQRTNFKCFYCFDTLDKKSWQLDHFHARANGGKNNLFNLAPSCKWCNQMKNALDGNSFLVRCKRIFMANLTVDIPHPIIAKSTVSLQDFPIKDRSKKVKRNKKLSS